jgi:hypothetical protein
LKTITIRGLEPMLIDRMKEFAKQQNQSLNQFVVETLMLHMGMKKEKKFTAEYHDLDYLFGRWPEKEFNRIQGRIDSERKIDKELWR